MSAQNLWGDLPEVGKIKIPLQILKEQASALNEMTKGLLVGTVQPWEDKRGFGHLLSIRAPALNNYTVAILRIGHSIELYPLRLVDMIAQTGVDCADEDAFVRDVSKILQSDKTRQIIKALLAQSGSNK